MAKPTRKWEDGGAEMKTAGWVWRKEGKAKFQFKIFSTLCLTVLKESGIFLVLGDRIE